MQTIFLVRHGETQWNAEDRIQDDSQHISLNEEGIRQSRLIAKRLAGEKIDLVFSSPQERALQTAEIIAEIHGLGVITHAGLSERSHGALDGMRREEFKEKYPKAAEEYEKTREYPGIEGVEPLDKVAKRAMDTFKEIVMSNPKKTIVIVAHGGINKGIIGKISGAGYTSFQQHNCCLNIIKYDGKSSRLRR